MWNLLKRVVLGAIGAVGLAGLACALLVVLDIRAFEWKPLFDLVGWYGVVYVSLLASGLGILSVSCLRFALWPRRARGENPIFSSLPLVLWLLAVLWLGEWVFMERPLTVRLASQFIGSDDEGMAIGIALDRARSDGSLAALGRDTSALDERRLSIMLARIAVNRPSVFDGVSIGEVIDRYARRYEVSPVLLLHWAYIDSFYGEAPSGPMPFFREINAEMFRDLIQAHLPSWFVESPIRVWLIEGPLFDVAGEEFGKKLRYAVQKASYDIAITPYMNSVYSDLFLILQEYRSEFPELFGHGSPDDPLVRAFLALDGNVLLEPYDDPYAHGPVDDEYYERYRRDLKSFARAAVYRLASDFEFATKVQALVARHYADEYKARIGTQRWSELSERQQTVLLAMLRDVYVPNIGRVSYNLYMCPEFNLTPISFLSEELAAHYDAIGETEKIWLPEDRSRLWGATGLMLRTLGEVWETVSGAPLAGIAPADTVADAVRVLSRYN